MSVEPLIIDVNEVAETLGVCTKHVRQMSKEGRMPKELRVGSRITRWSRKAIHQWVADGCPDLREVANR